MRNFDFSLKTYNMENMFAKCTAHDSACDYAQLLGLRVKIFHEDFDGVLEILQTFKRTSFDKNKNLVKLNHEKNRENFFPTSRSRISSPPLEVKQSYYYYPLHTKSVPRMIFLSQSDSGSLPYLIWDSLKQYLVDSGFQMITILARNSFLKVNKDPKQNQLLLTRLT